MLFDVFEQHLIYCIGDFVEISYAIKKEPLLRDSHQMPMVGLEPTRPQEQQILSLSRLPVPTHRLIQLFDLKYTITFES